MKALIDYIYEGRMIIFDEYERDSLCEIIGFLTGNLGEDADIKKFSKYWDALSDDEKKQMNDLYELLDNKETWPKVNSKLIHDDIHLLLNFLNWADEEELIDDKNYEIYDVIEKLEQI